MIRVFFDPNESAPRANACDACRSASHEWVEHERPETYTRLFHYPPHDRRRLLRRVDAAAVLVALLANPLPEIRKDSISPDALIHPAKINV